MQGAQAVNQKSTYKVFPINDAVLNIAPLVSSIANAAKGLLLSLSNMATAAGLIRRELCENTCKNESDATITVNNIFILFRKTRWLVSDYLGAVIIVHLR